ncbi:TonB-dependent receptor [Niabella defluvii]|nr:TonB-dependent receptor [Niabella sp. I65]
MRYAQNKLALFSSVSYSSVNNFPLSIGVPGAATGTIINQSTFGSSRTYSWETEISYELLRGLNLRGMATLEDAKFTSYDITVSPDADPSIASTELSWKGNRPERLPTTNFQLSATYDYKGFNLYANAIFIGSRWSTNANTYKLDGYNEVNTGVGYTFNKKLELRTWVNNLLDSRGLTEGNVRGEQFINVNNLQNGQLMLGRAILPRSYWVSLSFTF